MSSALVDLFRHNLWATRQLLAFCGQLTDAQLDAGLDGVYGSIRDTLAHIVRSEEVYTALLTDNKWQPDPAAPAGLEGLRARAERCGTALLDVAAQDQTGRILRGERRGEPYVMPAVVPLIQAIHHANEHRAQIATVLTQQGVTPPVLDGWTFWYEGMVGVP